MSHASIETKLTTLGTLNCVWNCPFSGEWNDVRDSIIGHARHHPILYSSCCCSCCCCCSGVVLSNSHSVLCYSCINCVLAILTDWYANKGREKTHEHETKMNYHKNRKHFALFFLIAPEAVKARKIPCSSTFFFSFTCLRSDSEWCYCCVSLLFYGLFAGVSFWFTITKYRFAESTAMASRFKGARTFGLTRMKQLAKRENLIMYLISNHKHTYITNEEETTE